MSTAAGREVVITCWGEGRRPGRGCIAGPSGVLVSFGDGSSCQRTSTTRSRRSCSGECRLAVCGEPARRDQRPKTKRPMWRILLTPNVSVAADRTPQLKRLQRTRGTSCSSQPSSRGIAHQVCPQQALLPSTPPARYVPSACARSEPRHCRSSTHALAVADLPSCTAIRSTVCSRGAGEGSGRADPDYPDHRAVSRADAARVGRVTRPPTHGAATGE